MNFAALQKAQSVLNKPRKQEVNAAKLFNLCFKNHDLVEYLLKGHKINLLDKIEQIEDSINIPGDDIKLTVADLLEI